MRALIHQDQPSSEVQVSLTNVQVDCLRRLADPSDERPAFVAESLQLPTPLQVTQHMAWPCASLKLHEEGLHHARSDDSEDDKKSTG